ncbi:MAG: SDR family oxidoreductase [Pirellulaceae bacterium]
MSKLIFGCGYLGSRVASLWLDAGHTVSAVTRSQDRAAEFRARGLRPIVADVTTPETLQALPDADTLLFAVGFDRGAGKSIREVYVEGLRAVLDALPTTVGRILYISSTGVYGQRDEQWVDEDSPCEPTREGGKACLAAEQLLRQHPLGDRAVILRMAGIYGPGRIPRSADIVRGTPLPSPSEGYLNLIHVEDAARIVLAAEVLASDARAPLPRTYTVSDGHPVPRRAYYEELARLLDAPPPTFIAPDPDSPAASRAEGSKRVANTRLVAELSPTFAYPSYREGLAAITSEA